MSKSFRIKAIFLCLLIFIACFFCVLPKTRLFAQGENGVKVSVNYSLISLGYSNVKDSNSLVVEEIIGIELDCDGFSQSSKTELFNEVFNRLKNFKNILDFRVDLFDLNESIVISDAQIEDNMVFVKLRYLNLSSYYIFNERMLPDDNTEVKLFDYFEKELFYTKYFILINNPYGAQSGQKSLNLFRDTSYNNIIGIVKKYSENITTNYIFDYSSQDNRLYGDFNFKYNSVGINNNTIYIYRFVFTDNLPKILSFYFITFNQYVWYLVAIAITLIVIAVLYVVLLFRKTRKIQTDEHLG